MLLLGAACTIASREATPSSTPFSVGGRAAAIGCGNNIDPFGPDGREADLAGLWTSPEYEFLPVWNVRRVRDCFFMVFRDPYLDTDYSDQICDGSMHVTFRITGRCVEFRGLGGRADLRAHVFLILFGDTNEVRLQKCPTTLATGSCDEPLIRFDPGNLPAATASPS